MGILKKLITALKGGATNIGQEIVDRNGIVILEQEVRDTETAIASAKKSLTETMAQKEKLEREIEHEKQQAKTYEEQIIALMEKGEEATAAELAERLDGLEESIAENQKFLDAFENNINNMKEQIKERQKGVERIKREISSVKTAKQINDATVELTTNGILGKGSSLAASESLKRIKDREHNRAAQFKAAETLESEFSGSATDAKVKELLKKDKDPLARFRNKEKSE